MDDAGQITKNGQKNIDEEVGAAAALEENANRREDDGEDDFANVAIWQQSMSAN